MKFLLSLRDPDNELSGPPCGRPQQVVRATLREVLNRLDDVLRKANTMTLDTAATLLSQLAGAPVRNYSTRDFGRDKNPDARSVVVSTNRSRQALEEFRRRLDPKFIAFIGTTRWLGDEQHSDAEEIVVAEADSQFDALTIAQSDAANYDMFADDLIKKLRAYDELCGIDIFHAETDTIEFRLRRPDGSFLWLRDERRLLRDELGRPSEVVGSWKM